MARLSSAAMSASASAVPTTGLYEPLAPPFREVSDANRGAYALLTAVILIIISGLTCTVKLQMTAVTFRKLRLDDHAVIAALVCRPDAPSEHGPEN